MKIKCLDGTEHDINSDNLSNFSFVGVKLHRALLDGLSLNNSKFINVDLRGGFLSDTNLKGAVFENSCLISAFFVRANLSDSIVMDCKARFCRFSKSIMDNSVIKGTDLFGAKFDGVSLLGSIIDCDMPEKIDFSGAIYNESTVWPVNFDPQKFGAIKIR